MLLLTLLLACTADSPEVLRSEGDFKPLATSAIALSGPTRFDAMGFAEARGRSLKIVTWSPLGSI